MYVIWPLIHDESSDLFLSANSNTFCICLCFYVQFPNTTIVDANCDRSFTTDKVYISKKLYNPEGPSTEACSIHA